ncbi:MAG: hypothetical protein FWG39_04300 [Alphaproteobacteria bacterium]|nr:hypothetical protein [Alphaproteobacteria bacterium]
MEKQIIKLLKFIDKNEFENYTPQLGDSGFWFYQQKLVGTYNEPERDKDGGIKWYVGQDLPALQKILGTKDDDKIKEVLRKARLHEYTTELFQMVCLTKKGRQHLKDVASKKSEVWRAWIIPIITACIGLVGAVMIAYYFPNKTEIRNQVQIELQNKIKIHNQ